MPRSKTKKQDEEIIVEKNGHQQLRKGTVRLCVFAPRNSKTRKRSQIINNKEKEAQKERRRRRKRDEGEIECGKRKSQSQILLIIKSPSNAQFRLV